MWILLRLREERANHERNPADSVRHRKVIDSSRSATARPGSRPALAHHRLLACLHEEGVFARLQIIVERNAIGADRDMFGFERNLLVALDSRFTSGHAPK